MEQKKGLTLNQLIRLDRLRTAYANRTPHITKKALAEECHYAERYMSHMFKGTRPVSDNAAEVLAPVLHVRREYLCGIDNVMTDNELQKKKKFADAFTALIEYAVKNTQGAFEYGFITPNSELSDYDELDNWDLALIQKSQDEGYYTIIKTYEDTYGDETHDLSVVNNDNYYKLVRDICDFITLRVAHEFNNNHMETTRKQLEFILNL